MEPPASSPETRIVEPVDSRSPHEARPDAKLSVDSPPPDAINLNVEGRKVNPPIEGFGRLWRKRYRIRLNGSSATPEQVITAWKAHFDEFWPGRNRFYAPVTGLKPGEVAVVNLEMPGGAKLSTGVVVLHADATSFVLMTPQGHIFAGLITFSADDDGGASGAQAEIVMRASDPLFEIGMELIGHRRENEFWTQTLEALANHFGAQGAVEAQVECLDFRHQWSKAGNVWYNAAIRTALYQAVSPLRRLVERAEPSPAADPSEPSGSTRSPK
jgi:hypothetical protein